MRRTERYSSYLLKLIHLGLRKRGDPLGSVGGSPPSCSRYLSQPLSPLKRIPPSERICAERVASALAVCGCDIRSHDVSFYRFDQQYLAGPGSAVTAAETCWNYALVSEVHVNELSLKA